MIFNKHYEYAEDDHAFLSPSKYHWVNYSLEKLETSYNNWEAVKRGTRLHAFAKEAIELGVKLPRSEKTLNMFVNDAIGYRMTPEQILVYSVNCFGTADAISFHRNLLRIHDLKTGVTKSSMTQLEIYAALFCLEYSVNPIDIDIELRIYQNDEVLVHEPDSIEELMSVIIRADKHISAIKQL
jgi:hypothetical protein